MTVVSKRPLLALGGALDDTEDGQPQAPKPKTPKALPSFYQFDSKSERHHSTP